MRRLMMTMFCALFALATLPDPAVAQDPIVGDWDVTVSVAGQEIPLVLHVLEGETGLEGSYDAQGATGLPIGAISHEHPTIRIELETGGAPAILEGTHEGETLTGAFSQGPATGTFTAKKRAPEAAPEDATPGEGR